MLESATRGRCRFRVGALYRSPELERFLERSFTSSTRRARANALTGSLLLLSDEDTAELARELEATLRRFAEQRGIGYATLERSPRRARGLEIPRSLRARLSEVRSVEPLPPSEEPEPWHTRDAEEVLTSLGSHAERGLSVEEARARLLRYGVNLLRGARPRSPLLVLVDQLRQWPFALLGGSVVLSLATGGVADAAAILVVIAANATIGTITESSAERTIAALAKEVPSSVLVLRDGALESVDVKELVPGDIVEVQRGSRLGFDARLLSATELVVDESTLTGESLPVTKTPEVLHDSKLPLAERRNMLYRGTTLIGGSGRAVVVATGGATELGGVQRLLDQVSEPRTPMQQQLEQLGERTLLLALASCSSVLVLGLLRGRPMLSTLKTAVSLAVAAVPEGLPTVAITTLGVGIRRMRERHVIVRRLNAIETLGAVQVLCFDKTGTITENRMQAQELAIGRRRLVVDGELRARATPGLEELLNVATLCNEAVLDEAGLIQGSPTESALLRLALDLGVDVAKLRAERRLLDTEYRAEGRNWMSTLHERPDGTRFLAVKGSVDEVLANSSHHRVEGHELELGALDRARIRRQNTRMAEKGRRVLGFATRELREGGKPSLTWLGLVGLSDPPRAETAEVLARLHRAGIRTVMITGDQRATAEAIAHQIGLASASHGEAEPLVTVEATELENLGDEEFARMAREVHVFARVNPTDKLRIVKALQASGYVVAMTGDGINDGPALKAADVGVAMGSRASDLAREVADVILERDDLLGMLTAIEHGRVLYDDIQKAVHFILSTNLSEIVLTLATSAVGRQGDSLSATQLLWINLVSDIFPELALALLPAERDVLERAPRPKDQPMFAAGHLRQIGLEGATLAAGAFGAAALARRSGRTLEASTLGFLTLTSAQLLHALSASSRRRTVFERTPLQHSPYVPLSVLGGIGLTLLAHAVPSLRTTLRSATIAPSDLPLVAVGSVATLLANESWKLSRRPGQRGLSGPPR